MHIIAAVRRYRSEGRPLNGVETLRELVMVSSLRHAPRQSSLESPSTNISETSVQKDERSGAGGMVELAAD